MIGFFKKKVKAAEVAPQHQSDDDRIKSLSEKFLYNNSIEIIEDKQRRKVSPIKWLYPGYGEFINHAIVPKDIDKMATEMVNEAKFVNDFLQNKRDVEGTFSYFVARIEYNYIKMASEGNKLFDAIGETDIDDYDTLVLIKQAKRLFPKFNEVTLTIDLKHIEIFGEIFNKLKSSLAKKMAEAEIDLISIDIPTYSSTSIQVENSLQAYNTFKLSQALERLCDDERSRAISVSQAQAVVSQSLKDTEKVKDALFVAENSKRYHQAIENLEKITNQLAEIDTLLHQMSLK